MSTPLRKGWCPGALRPMAAADGLVVRLRPTGGILAATTAQALAALAARHGNGRLDLTSRANLQMRGVGETALPALLDGLRTLGLVDADAASEAVRNVVASPLAGLHDGLDIRPFVAALEARLSGTPALHALPPKVFFLVDDGSVPSLAGIAADVRFDWRADDGVFAIGLSGTRAGATPAGTCAPGDLVDRAEAIARGAVAGFGRNGEARRLNTLIATLGEAEVLRLCGAHGQSSVATSSPVKRGRGTARSAVEGAAALTDGFLPHERTLGDRSDGGPLHHPSNGPPPPFHGGGCARLGLSATGRALALTAPYGRLDTGMLHAAADLAIVGLGELRLTPWRSLLLPGVASAHARDRAKQVGWIVDDTDPRLAVAACVGAPECERATVFTRADADALAALASTVGATRPRLHISGCAKGCAHAGAASIVLVGRDGRYDLVRDGRAGDVPMLRGLDLDAARSAIAGLLPR